MTATNARRSAYAELIAGLLDVRDHSSEEQFDTVLASALSEERIDSETARLLRWWQRESVRALVDHAQTVLPATLIALEEAASAPHQAMAKSPTEFDLGTEFDLNTELDPGTEFDLAKDPLGQGVAPEAEWVEEPEPPTDLSARRLLVAGLTPLRDP
ncbi:MAG TPA: hypothetical protein VMT88_13965 [Actinomycetes bacterium]|nr:hypothetical protein [Actinomycetes bacterium]